VCGRTGTWNTWRTSPAGARLAIAAVGKRGDHAAPEGERRAVLFILDDFPLTAIAVEEQQRRAAAYPAAPLGGCDVELRQPVTHASGRPGDQRETDARAVIQDHERGARGIGEPARDKFALAPIPFAERREQA
jgi:hypothetical protein